MYPPGALPAPRPRSVSELKSAFSILKPATTSHFQAWFIPPLAVDYWIENEADNYGYGIPNRGNEEFFSILCSDASLPGSSLMTHEQNNDFHGVTQRYAYRKDYGTGVDFSFIVDGDHYMLFLFEGWLRFITNEVIPENTEDSDEQYPAIDKRYFYSRVNYPREYISPGGIYINKFERDYRSSGGVTYQFVDAYPTAISAIPVSYDASQLLKVNVTITYSRYYVKPLIYDYPPEQPVSLPPTLAPSADVPDELRDDWAIWYMTWGRSRRDVLTRQQLEFGNRVEARIKGDPNYLSGLQSRAQRGGYTVPGPTARPGMGPGPLQPTGRPLGNVKFINSPGYNGSVLTGGRSRYETSPLKTS